MDEMLQQTVDMLIDLDEPEQILPTLRKAAERRRGPRWQALAHVLGDAEIKLDQLLNAKPAGPDFRPPVDPEFEQTNRDFMKKQAPPVNTDEAAKSA